MRDDLENVEYTEEEIFELFEKETQERKAHLKEKNIKKQNFFKSIKSI